MAFSLDLREFDSFMQVAVASTEKVKLTCDACGARYRIPASKVDGRRFKATCKRCGATIMARFAEGEISSLDNEEIKQTGDPRWYLVVDGKPRGPYNIEQLRDRLQQGRAAVDSYLWRDGEQEWLRLEDIPELASLVKPQPAEPEELPTRAAGRHYATNARLAGSGQLDPHTLDPPEGDYPGDHSERSTDPHGATRHQPDQDAVAFAETHALVSPDAGWDDATEQGSRPSARWDAGFEQGNSPRDEISLDDFEFEAEPTRLVARDSVLPKQGERTGEVKDPDRWSREIALGFGDNPGKVTADEPIAPQRDMISEPRLWLTGTRAATLPPPPLVPAGSLSAQEASLKSGGLPPPPGAPPAPLRRPDEESLLIEPDQLPPTHASIAGDDVGSDESDIVASLVPVLPIAPPPPAPKVLVAGSNQGFWTPRRIVLVTAASSALVICVAAIVVALLLRRGPQQGPRVAVTTVQGSVDDTDSEIDEKAGREASSTQAETKAEPKVAESKVAGSKEAGSKEAGSKVAGSKVAGSKEAKSAMAGQGPVVKKVALKTRGAPSARAAVAKKPRRARRVYRRRSAGKRPARRARPKTPPAADDVDSLLSAAAGRKRPAKRTPAKKPSGDDSADDILAAAAGGSTRGASQKRSLSKEQVGRGLRKLNTRAQACLDRFGQGGVLKLRVSIYPNGKARAVVLGRFSGTPMGACVARAVPGLRFPRFSGKAITVVYPIRLN